MTYYSVILFQGTTFFYADSTFDSFATPTSLLVVTLKDIVKIEGFNFSLTSFVVASKLF